ncbi:MAG: nucleotide exchange factor GrpE, partial [Bacillota bacterium]
MTKKKNPEDDLNTWNEPDTNPSEGVEEEAVQENAEKEEKEVSKEEEELNVRYLRLAADFQNYKRRAEKEKSDIYAYANEKIVVDLLDVIDNFERALEHSKDNSEGFAEGMNMIFKQFRGVLEKSGVEEMNAIGEPFDPNFH